jgi:hypothetical protein
MEDVDYSARLGNSVCGPRETSQIDENEITALPRLPEWNSSTGGVTNIPKASRVIKTNELGTSTAVENTARVPNKLRKRQR